MSDTNGRIGQFVWRELLCSEPEKAMQFYAKLFGWRFVESTSGGAPYWLLEVGKAGHHVGGVMRLPDASMPPQWGSYLAVADVDQAWQKVEELGGGLHMPPTEIPEVGRFAVVSDPTGATFTLWRSSSNDDGPAQPRAAGEFCWETLGTTDVAKAKAFYSELVGWTALPGPGGASVMKAGEVMVGDIDVTQPGVPSHWLQHVAVENLTDAASRAKALGATLLNKDFPVPGFGKLTVFKDPVGAVLSIFEPIS